MKSWWHVSQHVSKEIHSSSKRWVTEPKSRRVLPHREHRRRSPGLSDVFSTCWSSQSRSWDKGKTKSLPKSKQVAITWLSLYRQNTTTHLLAGAADKPHSSAEHPSRKGKTILTLTSDIITWDRVFQRANQMHWSWGLFQWNSSCVMVLFLDHKEFN